MHEDAQLLSILVAFMIVELLAVIIICLWAALFEPREPHDVRIPDHVPPEWGPMGGIDVLPTYHVGPEDAPPMGGLPPARREPPKQTGT